MAKRATDPIRSIHASIAANKKWAQLNRAQRSDATAAARAGLDRRFEDEVDPDGTLDPDERAAMVANAKRAHYQAMALKSAIARRKGAA